MRVASCISHRMADLRPRTPPKKLKEILAISDSFEFLVALTDLAIPPGTNFHPPPERRHELRQMISTLNGFYMYVDMHSATPPRDAPHDWGTPAYYHRTYLCIIAVTVVALLVVTPNRWLVSSRISFSIVLIIALCPLSVGLLFFISELSPGQDFMAAYFLCFMLLLIALWPMSLCLSFWRCRKGETFFYA